MFGMMRVFLGKIQYRRRWGRLAAAAEAAADSATADLDHREQSRNFRHLHSQIEHTAASSRAMEPQQAAFRR
ncbi:hypothetical protein [Siccirubricoccus sp. G192]|uniref:hypothetical protein n=1 Tax=Siccirubricoccus sp. G192 TaxID=2849651 RepID=UPI001C2BFD3C|nr:hypothetical protein [Siccirubricoccus sp. G192]MBV1796540.1 hypothetical protein [Siccirubricoccus sp. G192]